MQHYYFNTKLEAKTNYFLRTENCSELENLILSVGINQTELILLYIRRRVTLDEK